MVVQLSQQEKRGASEGSNATVCKLQERLKSVEGRLKAQSSEHKKREDAMDLIKRDSARCKELETNLVEVNASLKLQYESYI